MGDRITIPRTMAGLIGVADVQNSIRRKYIEIDISPTTARHFGNNTTGGIKFDRPITLERCYVSKRLVGGTTSHTAKFFLAVFKNASTVFRTGTVPWGSTGKLWGATTGWKCDELTPLSNAVALILDTDRLTVNVPNHTTQDRIKLVLQFREELDQ